jgi:molecular chaperone GrpE
MAGGQETPANDPAPETPESGEVGADAAEDNPLEDATELLDSDIARLQEELEQAKDMALRAQADAQNVKRRAEQDVEKARKYALERFCSELLPVVDNLERALEAASGDDEAMKPIAEGVELTLKSFLGALEKFQIKPVDPAGEPFDPEFHQAMSMVENPDAEPNTVLAVMQKGYTLNGRLVRPAMVMVSKAPA